MHLCLEWALFVFVCLPPGMQSAARFRRKASAATQSVPASAPFHCGPASETEHEAQGIEVH